MGIPWPVDGASAVDAGQFARAVEELRRNGFALLSCPVGGEDIGAHGYDRFGACVMIGSGHGMELLFDVEGTVPARYLLTHGAQWRVERVFDSFEAMRAFLGDAHAVRALLRTQVLRQLVALRACVIRDPGFMRMVHARSRYEADHRRARDARA